MPKQLPSKPKPSPWVQTERAAHEAWIKLIDRSPLAAKVMHLLANRVGEHNAVVISQGNIAKLLGAHRRSVVRALALLEADRWIEIRQIGERATVNAYVVNDRVVWHGSRKGQRYSLFSAMVVATEDEQPDGDELGEQEALRHLPKAGEQQLPAGDGLPPPSQPSIVGLEPDLPARSNSQLDIVDAIDERAQGESGEKLFRCHDGRLLTLEQLLSSDLSDLPPEIRAQFVDAPKED